MRSDRVGQLLQTPVDEAVELALSIRAKQDDLDELLSGTLNPVFIVPQGVYPDFAGISKIRGQLNFTILHGFGGEDVINFVERSDGNGGQIVDFGEKCVNDAPSMLHISISEEGFNGQPVCLWTVAHGANPVHRDFGLFLKALEVWPNTGRQQIIRSDANVPSLLKALPFCLSSFKNGCALLGLPHATFKQRAEALTEVLRLFYATKGYEPISISIAKTQQRHAKSMRDEIGYLGFLFKRELTKMGHSPQGIEEICQQLGLRKE